MTTPIYLTGFEHGVTPTSNGGGLAAFVQNVTIVSAEHHTGNYALKATPVGSAGYIRVTLSSAPGESCGRIYFKVETEPTTDQVIYDNILTTGGTSGNPRLYMDVATNTVSVRAGSTVIGTSSNTYTIGEWHYVDYCFDINQNPWTLKAKLDGGTEFSGTHAVAADTSASIRIGLTLGASTAVLYYDDIVITSGTSDYPIGAGGTELLVPSGSATSNVGVNTIEEQNGTDAGITSYAALASVPMGNATAYIRQATAGTTNYLGFSFGNISASHSAILGARGILAYTSATTSSNRGACIISKDGFSSFSEIWGNPTVTTDYSDGSTGNPYWKTAIIAGVVDDTTVNALEGRVGYSNDVAPNPYWLDLAVEVAYSSATNDISLTLVTYSYTYPAVTVLENIVISLDLVSYTSTFPSAVITENIDIALDLVTYTNTIQPLTLLESVVISLDLVSYTNGYLPISVLENVIVPLDLVSYTISYPTISILENVIVPLDHVIFSSSYPTLIITENVVISLDRVTYSSNYPVITISENIVVPLDLVLYSTTFNPITTTDSAVVSLDVVAYSSTINQITTLESIVDELDLVTYSLSFPQIVLLENTVVPLDLVNYTSNVLDITLLENVVISLDLVVYSSSFTDIDLLEEGSIALDLVTYSVTIPNLTILEHILLPLDTVTYSTSVFTIDLLEEGSILLDLVTYSSFVGPIVITENVLITLSLVIYDSTINDILVYSPDDSVNVPISRTYAVEKETRVFAIEDYSRLFTIAGDNRTFSVGKEDRIYPIP